MSGTNILNLESGTKSNENPMVWEQGNPPSFLNRFPRVKHQEVNIHSYSANIPPL